MDFSNDRASDLAVIIRSELHGTSALRLGSNVRWSSVHGAHHL
ncbi:hypothetical protein BDA96_08G015600 [Sorghum bicolor]|uniref:Uncharacterized protein n=1 Tax=Sorghum bicolor TaxID=4558 RepID=A0A921QDL3_SORBI|nr:hypothetical protein BDA96_08G015600 [Sorghum bicolor]